MKDAIITIQGIAVSETERSEPVYRSHGLTLLFGDKLTDQIMGEDPFITLDHLMELFSCGTLCLTDVIELNYTASDTQLTSLRDIPNVRIVDADGQAHFYCLRFTEALQDSYRLTYTSALMGHLLLHPTIDAIRADLIDRGVAISWSRDGNELVSAVGAAFKRMEVSDRAKLFLDRGRLDMTLPNGVRIRSHHRNDVKITSRHFLLGMGDRPYRLYRLDIPIRLEHNFDPDIAVWEELEMDIEDIFLSNGLIASVVIDNDPEMIGECIQNMIMDEE